MQPANTSSRVPLLGWQLMISKGCGSGKGYPSTWRKEGGKITWLAETASPSFGEGVTPTVSCCYLLLRNNSQGSPTNAEATLDQHLELLLMCVRATLDAAVPYKLIAVFVWEFPSHSKVREMPSQGASRLRSWAHVALHHQSPPAVHNKDWLPHTAKKRQRDVWRVRFSTDNKNTRGSHQMS